MNPFKKNKSTIYDPLKEHKEMMDSILNPLKEHQAMMASLAAPLKEHRAMMASLADPLKEHHAMMASLTAPLKEHRAMMEAIINPMKQFQDTVASIADPFGSLSNQIRNSTSFSLLKQMAEVELNSSAVASNDFTEEVVSSVSSEILLNSVNSEAENFDVLIKNLIVEVQALKEPKLQQRIVNIIYPMILMVISVLLDPVADYHIKAHLNADKRVQNKIINEQVVSAITNKDQLGILRYVSATTLNVRGGPSVKSDILGNLHYGYVVTVIKKDKKWCLVEWVDSESEMKLSGWVFSRYLKRFK